MEQFSLFEKFPKRNVRNSYKLIDVSKATGCDNIGPLLLKLAAFYIAESVTYICNQSIKLPQFLDKWKEASVTPLHKGGHKDDLNSYRPIYILSFISRLLEKHICDSLMTFLTEFNYCLKISQDSDPIIHAKWH